MMHRLKNVKDHLQITMEECTELASKVNCLQGDPSNTSNVSVSIAEVPKQQNISENQSTLVEH